MDNGITIDRPEYLPSIPERMKAEADTAVNNLWELYLAAREESIKVNGEREDLEKQIAGLKAEIKKRNEEIESYVDKMPSYILLKKVIDRLFGYDNNWQKAILCAIARKNCESCPASVSGWCARDEWESYLNRVMHQLEIYAEQEKEYLEDKCHFY